jgi:hypothetical protein
MNPDPAFIWAGYPGYGNVVRVPSGVSTTQCSVFVLAEHP